MGRSGGLTGWDGGASTIIYRRSGNL